MYSVFILISFIRSYYFAWIMEAGKQLMHNMLLYANQVMT